MISILLVLATVSIHAYSFNGTHYIGTYSECKLLEYNGLVLHALLNASAASGATVLKYSLHEFEPQGMTAVVLLSESHASVHTYPETGSVFVDLFTCGDTCDWKPFEDMLISFLEPKNIERTIIQR
jgi:S-adenosylmethionine decarboxylase